MQCCSLLSMGFRHGDGRLLKRAHDRRRKCTHSAALGRRSDGADCAARRNSCAVVDEVFCCKCLCYCCDGCSFCCFYQRYDDRGVWAGNVHDTLPVRRRCVACEQSGEDRSRREEWRKQSVSKLFEACVAMMTAVIGTMQMNENGWRACREAPVLLTKFCATEERTEFLQNTPNRNTIIIYCAVMWTR